MAGILCNDPGFQAFVAERTGQLSQDKDTAAAFLRRECGIASRRELNTDPAAREAFDRLRTEVDAFTGKIPQPR
ncbi:MAG: hypothetical protein EP318_15570 [Rhodobacteraceae bacterium]|nr:MAG: hypothetical protein EP318_15570 [Paracoccaceae bacterium]